MVEKTIGRKKRSSVPHISQKTRERMNNSQTKKGVSQNKQEMCMVQAVKHKGMLLPLVFLAFRDILAAQFQRFHLDRVDVLSVRNRNAGTGRKH